MHLNDFIQERLESSSDKSTEQPDDLLQWLIDVAPPIEKTVPQLAERIMALNVASIHTTVMVCWSTVVGPLSARAILWNSYKLTIAIPCRRSALLCT